MVLFCREFGFSSGKDFWSTALSIGTIGTAKLESARRRIAWGVMLHWKELVWLGVAHADCWIVECVECQTSRGSWETRHQGSIGKDVPGRFRLVE